MKTFLTGSYLSLMNAFANHSDARVEHICNSGFYVPDSQTLFKEYCTLKLDGGRQSGKTKAVSIFATEWLADGGSIVILSNNTAYANVSATAIRKEYFNNHTESIKYRLYTDSVRSFIGNTACKFRGLSLSRVLYIIDEPVKTPDMDKIYDAHIKVVQHCCRASCEETNQTTRPLFFVIGMQ